MPFRFFGGCILLSVGILLPACTEEAVNESAQTAAMMSDASVVAGEIPGQTPTPMPDDVRTMADGGPTTPDGGPTTCTSCCTITRNFNTTPQECALGCEDPNPYDCEDIGCGDEACTVVTVADGELCSDAETFDSG